MQGGGFCPGCGGPLELRYVEAEERDRLVCAGCSAIHYINPKIVAGTIPVQDGRIWLLRRAIEPRLGAWTFPAGFMEMGETVLEAAARETWEELTLRVEVEDLVGVYSRPEVSTVHIVYMARAISTPSAGKEALDIGLYAPEDIPWDDLAFWSTHQALRDSLPRLATR